VVSSGWFFLAAMIVAYGVANLLQSVAASRTDAHENFHLSLLLRLSRHRSYLLGLTFQFVGFLLAFLARRDLPLFLVQAAVAAGLGVTAVLGVAVLKWQLPRAEVGLLGLLGLGVGALVLAAQPAHAHRLGLGGVLVLTGVLAVIALGGFFAVRLRGAPGSVALGGLAGLAFSAAAVASRPLAAAHQMNEFLTDPLLYLLIAHSIVGQLLLGLAMQRGSTTAAVASMDAAGAAPAAVVGLLFLGAEIRSGYGWLAGAGFVATLAAVIGLTRYAEPQHHCGDSQPPEVDTALPAEPRPAALAGTAGPAEPSGTSGTGGPAEPAVPVPHAGSGGGRPGRDGSGRGVPTPARPRSVPAGPR